MADFKKLSPTRNAHRMSLVASRPEKRPLPSRTHSEQTAEVEQIDDESNHVRRKSAYTMNLQRSKHHKSLKERPLSTVQEQRDDTGTRPRRSTSGSAPSMLTPPLTPVKSSSSAESSPESAFTIYDFSNLDYELERAHAIGKGLWSSVFLAQPTVKSPQSTAAYPLTPGSSPGSNSLSSSLVDSPIDSSRRRSNTPEEASAPAPRKSSLPPRLYAVKIPARADAKEIFYQEAKILTTLQMCSDSHHYIVPFYGLDTRNSSLIFEGVIGGSLEDLNSRLKCLTELARHLEIRTLFTGLANDLVNGLQFMHSAGIVHGDIKSANVLLDISDHYALPGPVLRARYIDFSASFMVGTDSIPNSGGTWDFMAPEQLSRQKELNTPTFASDVWSLGITLLSIIVGGSPYSAACGGNLFMLREAIKSGDPLGFAKMDGVVQKRLAACQDFVDCCRLTLQKDRTRRTTAAAWSRHMMDLS